MELETKLMLERVFRNVEAGGFERKGIELGYSFTKAANTGLELSVDDCFRLGHQQRLMENRIREERLVTRFEDKETGMGLFLGLDTLGNGIVFGGVRLLPFGNTDEALRDALRLGEAMTHKLSMIYEPYGGGKLVATAPESGKGEAVMFRIGEFVERLKGLLRIAIDYGFDSADALKIRERTQFIDGFDGPGSLGASGVPTAIGAFQGMGTLLEEAFGSPKISGRSFAIQGAGSVGNKLAELLLEDGGRIFVSDTNEERLKPFLGIKNVTIVDPADLLFLDADVLCPSGPACVFNPATIPKLKSRAIAGVANCVLEDETRDDGMLKKRGILFAPDFVVNAGGVTQGVEEVFKGAKDLGSTIDRLPIIPQNLRAVFKKAREEQKGTMAAAKEMAVARRAGMMRAKI